MQTNSFTITQYTPRLNHPATSHSLFPIRHPSHPHQVLMPGCQLLQVMTQVAGGDTKLPSRPHLYLKEPQGGFCIGQASTREPEIQKGRRLTLFLFSNNNACKEMRHGRKYLNHKISAE